MYVSANLPRWIPVDESDLRAALEDGRLEENHYIDVKREVPTGKAANKELARDMAQFAIDGGTLIVGIEETSGSFSLAPVQLSGMPERIEQVARSIPDPPLPVSCSTIPSETHEGRGYVIVTVPMSGLAPHMVENVYIGRGDKTKIRLSDSQVTSLHQRRRAFEHEAQLLLDAYISRDPVPQERRHQAHLYFVGAPIFARSEMLLHAVHGHDSQGTFERIRRAGLAATEELPGAYSFDPSLLASTQYALRPDGAAMTQGLTQDRQLRSLAEDRPWYNEDAFELELSEDGVVRLMTTRLSDASEGEQRIITLMIPVIARQLVAICLAVSHESGYSGPWAISCAANGVQGLSAYSPDWLFRGTTGRLVKDQSDYRQVITVTGEEFLKSPGVITRRLVGRLLRSIGEADRFSELLSDSIPTDRLPPQ